MPIHWIWGENQIKLDDTLPIYGIGLEFRDAKGKYVSISSIQMRSGETMFSAKRMINGFCVCSVVCVCLLVLWYKFAGCKKIKKNKKQKSIDAGRILENIYEECFLFSTQNFCIERIKIVIQW